MSIESRVKTRIPEILPEMLDEVVLTATDRIKLRVGSPAVFPDELESIAVDVACAIHNRTFYEGIKSENADTFSLSFVDDLLKEYDSDFKRYLESEELTKDENRGKVRFL